MAIRFLALAAMLVIGSNTLVAQSAEPKAAPETPAVGKATPNAPVVEKAAAGKAPVAEVDPAPKATVDLLKRCRTVLQHYWNANYAATAAGLDFKSAEAWEEAARAGDFGDYKKFGEAIAAQRRADTEYFGTRYDAMRKEIEAAHREKVAGLGG